MGKRVILSVEHHPGQCRGGPYAGQWRDYADDTMPVLVAPAAGDSGFYEWDGGEGKVGVWIWHPIQRKRRAI